MDSLAELIRRNASTGKVKAPQDARPRLLRLKGIKAVLFDVYGTLFSSSAGDISLVSKKNYNRLMQAVLLNNGFQLLNAGNAKNLHKLFLETIQQHQQKRRLDGITFPEVDIRSVWKDFLSQLRSTGVFANEPAGSIERLAVEFECRVNPVQVMPGLCDCLEFVRTSKRIMGIISNAQFYTPMLFSGLLESGLEELGFCDDISVWSYQLLEGKPSQRLYQVAAQGLQERFSIQPQDVLYIGNDIRNDIWPAQETGFRTALFAGDSLSLRRRLDDPSCNKIVPDIELTNLAQLAECLD